MKIISKDKSSEATQKNCYLIKLENEEEFFISDEDYFSKQIYAIDEVEPSFLKVLSENVILKKAKGYAIKYLLLKIRSSGEVIKKLSLLGFDRTISDKTIDYLNQNGYLDDTKFAQVFSNHLLKTKMVAKKQLEYELKSKGVAREIIFDVLEKIPTSDNETAKRLLNKKFKNIDPENSKQKAKISNYLMSKGFSFDVIKEVINESN